MVRLKDIAEAANVSISLVSKVLNEVDGNAPAGAKTKALIRETAQRMGYVRNRTAVSLITGRQNAVGLIMQPAGAPGCELVQTFLIGLADAANNYNQRLEMKFYYSAEGLQSAFERMDSSVVDGIIIHGFYHDYFMDIIKPRAIKSPPIVGVFHEILDARIPSVLTDGTNGTRLATEHLIQQGCKKLAHIGIWGKHVDVFAQTLKKHKLPFDKSRVYLNRIGGFTHQIGEDGVANLLCRETDFDGIVCQNDAYAFGAMQTLLAKGFRIPEDVKIIGSDNAPICEMASIPISSVYIDVEKTARLAMDLMMARINGQPCGSVSMLPQLVARASTANHPIL